MSQLHATQNVIKNKGSSQLELHNLQDVMKSYETPPSATRRTKHWQASNVEMQVGAKMMGS